tara:strand:+ start:122 stop:238 length:117 start_codon:yes stop_codon:yes gene_type:complete
MIKRMFGRFSFSAKSGVARRARRMVNVKSGLFIEADNR